MNDFAGWPAAPRLPGQPEPEALPLDTLPSALRAHIASVAAATQTPPDMAAMVALAAVSAALRGCAEVEADPRRGWREPAHIYAAVIMEPGARKSAVYAHMVAPLVKWEQEERERVGPAWRAAKDRADVADAALRHAQQQAARRKGSVQQVMEARGELDAATAGVPILPRLVASDATPEALVRLMEEQRGAIALLGPEADAIGIADGRYSDSARVDELLRAWSAEPLTVDRIGRAPIHVPRPALTLGLCLQPEVLADLRHARAFRGRGLLARVLWCQPPSKVGHRLTGLQVPALDVAAAERYSRTLRALLARCEPEDTPRALTLGPEAVRLLSSFEAEIEAEMQPGARLHGIADAACKLHGQAVRLAALLELAARAEDTRPLWSEPVGLWAVDGGVRLARALSTHALAVLGAAGLDELLDDMAYALKRIRELPEGSTVRDLHGACRGRASIAEADSPSDYLAELLDGLTERGCIRRLPVPVRLGPGRPPSSAIELHPVLRRAAPEPVPEPAIAEVVL